MSKQSKKQKFQDESGEALKNLLNDQVEARLKREISLSHGHAESVDHNREDEDKQSGHGSKIQSTQRIDDASLRKPPGSKETKSQLKERVHKLLEEVAFLEQDYYYLQSQVEVWEQTRKEYESRVEELENEKQALEEDLNSKAILVSQYQNQIQALNSHNERLQSEQGELSQKLARMEERLNDKFRENENLLSELEDSRTENDKLKKELDKVQQEKDALTRENQELQGKIQKLEAQLGPESKQGEVEEDMTGQDWRKKADGLWNGERYIAPQQAIDYISVALKYNSQQAGLYNDLGLAKLDDYRLQEALDDFTTALALNPDFAEAYHNRGVVLLREGKHFAAQKDFQMAARLGIGSGLNYLQGQRKRTGLIKRILTDLGILKGT